MRTSLCLLALAGVTVGCGIDAPGNPALPWPSADVSTSAGTVTGVTNAPNTGTGTQATAGGSSAATSVAPGESTGVATSNPASSGVSTTTAAETAPPPFEPAPAMLRRLTRTQFRNVMQDVFAFDVDLSDLDPDSWDGDFAAIGASKVVTSERGVEQYHEAIEQAVDALFADATKAREFVGCDATANAECVHQFIERMGRIAWRRPLTDGEVTNLVNIAQTIATDYDDPMEGLRWATVALFWSVNFIYRSESGVQANAGVLRYSGYEMASRLAFFLWNSAPDADLLDAASRGELDTPAGVRAAAERLLDTPAGRESVGAFAEEYMRLDRVGTQAKDPALFPEYNANLQAAMVKDMRDVWQAVAFDDNASAMELFSTKRVVVNADLARLYGIDDSGMTGDEFREVTLSEDSPRIGILGKAAFLSQFANQKEGSPTLRGKFIRQSLMCLNVPSPPGDVDLVIDEAPIDMPMTKRERLELHRENPSCANCHAFMDPLGLPLETFDALGRYRTTELGLEIDPSGDFDGTPVANARELGIAVSDSETVARCLVRKFYSYALGYPERTVDRVVVDELAGAFTDSGYKLRELVLAITGHEAFAAVAPVSDAAAGAP
jgi:hypothetical protein